MSAETWGIVLRDRATGAEQWVACEVRPMDDDLFAARVAGDNDARASMAHYARGAVTDRGARLTIDDRTLEFVSVETPGEYTAHMERVRSTLLRDEVERLRADRDLMLDAARRTHEAISPDTARAMWQIDEARLRERPAEYAHFVASLARDVMTRLRNETVETLRAERDAAVSKVERQSRILAMVSTLEALAFKRGAEAMRKEAAQEIERWPRYLPVDKVAAIHAIPLPAYVPSQPAQSHEAPAPPDAPQTIADAAARARSAAMERV